MTIEKGFVSQTAFKKHLDGNWKTVHELWSHVRDYMTSYPAPAATTYSKTEVDAFFEGYSGGKAQVDAGNVVGLTQGSIPFADASGFLTEDNSKLFWDDTNDNLGLGTTSFGANMVGGIQIATGTAPTGNVADTFAFYSADFAAGNACPYFRTENGTVIGLNQSLLTTDAPAFATGVTIGNLTLANGSITDSVGSISFGNEHLSTTGTIISGDITVENVAPHYYWKETGVTADNGLWDILANTELLYFRAINDANTVASNFIEVDRTGTTINYVNFPNGIIYINDIANAKMTQGLTINQGANDNEIIALKSSDIAHGVTGRAETDTYGTMAKVHADEGGLSIWGYNENVEALWLAGVAVSDNTDKNAIAKAPVIIDAFKKSGADIGAVGADANLFVIRNYTATRFIFDEDGDMFYDGAAPANYDNFNDPIACHDLQKILYNLKRPASEHLTDFIQYNRDDLVSMGVISDGGFVSTKGITALQLGAISQLYTKEQRLEARIEELEEKIKQLEA